MAGNHTVIKRYSNNYYCVMQLKGKKSDGVKPSVHDILQEDITTKKNDEKFRESLVRSRMNIFEISMCNDFDIFGTFTIDPKKYDRFHLKEFYKDFSKFVNNLNYQYDLTIQYLLIPEKHKDGAWHMHGLLKGLPRSHMRLFNLSEKLPVYIRNKLKSGENVFKWVSYTNRFGFCDLEYIRNKEACCKYIVKYITKDLSRSVKESHAKVYYCSQHLKRPEIVASGEFDEIITLPDFENCYVMKKDFFDLAQALEFTNVKFFDSFVNSGLDESTIESILKM